jgi:putative transposase
MARAHRYYEPGYVWHITQRCHEQKFFFKSEHFRRRWIYWLTQALMRYDFNIFNYMVTCNHIHLLAFCDSDENEIARAMHLISGRVAQEFNMKNERRGSFWEDRYHATAVQSNLHLIRCMVYIDMNMVRAGVIKHPKEWLHCGYHELIFRKKDNNLIELDYLEQMLGMDYENFKEIHKYLCEEYLDKQNFQREKSWTESIAVGNSNFVNTIKHKLKINSNRTKIIKNSTYFELR